MGDLLWLRNDADIYEEWDEDYGKHMGAVRQPLMMYKSLIVGEGSGVMQRAATDMPNCQILSS